MVTVLIEPFVSVYSNWCNVHAQRCVFTFQLTFNQLESNKINNFQL